MSAPKGCIPVEGGPKLPWIRPYGTVDRIITVHADGWDGYWVLDGEYLPPIPPPPNSRKQPEAQKQSCVYRWVDRPAQ